MPAYNQTQRVGFIFGATLQTIIGQLCNNSRVIFPTMAVLGGVYLRNRCQNDPLQ
jgi:hypothetical protein